jgi:hypothetical protein
MAAFASFAAFGQSLLDCVDADVLNGLLLQAPGERPLAITAAIPPEVSALRMPGGFGWIGSSERILGRVDATTNASLVTAAWRSNLAPEAARAATAAALTASGWEIQTQPRMSMGVFRPANQQVWQTACRQGNPLNFNAGTLDGVTYVLVNLQRGSNNTTCSQPALPQTMTRSVLEPYLPLLEMPVDPATGSVAHMRSGNSSFNGASVSASAEFAVEDSAGSIARHFARQLAEQGWTNDANWSGADKAGSTWSRRVDAATLAQGTLSVSHLGERQFVTVLRVSKLQ